MQPQSTTLRQLQIGDLFFAKKQTSKLPKLFRVVGPNEYSQGHGSAVRRCVDLTKKEFVNKSSRLEVVKYIK